MGSKDAPQKNAVYMCIRQVWVLLYKTKVLEKPLRFGRRRTEIGLNAMFLHVPRASEQGKICYKEVYE